LLKKVSLEDAAASPAPTALINSILVNRVSVAYRPRPTISFVISKLAFSNSK